MKVGRPSALRGARGKDLLQETLGDGHATRVDLAGLAESLECRVPLLIAGMGQALGTCGEADADAAVFVACWPPLYGVLVHHAPRHHLDRLTGTASALM